VIVCTGNITGLITSTKHATNYCKSNANFHTGPYMFLTIEGPFSGDILMITILENDNSWMLQ